MEKSFLRHSFETVISVEKIVTAFYMELSKDFYYPGESHDFWELVYIDRGEMLCTAKENRFILKSGELTFHKPNEFHNLSGTGDIVPNVCIITFECKSKAMKYFENKIFHPDSEEKTIISQFLKEALSCYDMFDKRNPLVQKLVKRDDAPFGSSQLTKNYLEMLLIKLQRNEKSEAKGSRNLIDGMTVPSEVEEIIRYLNNNLYSRITLETISAYLGKSQSAVKKQFSAYMKTGIIDYFNDLKIREAKRLICEKEIKEGVNYADPKNFAVAMCLYQKICNCKNQYLNTEQAKKCYELKSKNK